MYGQWRTACLGAAHSVKMEFFFGLLPDLGLYAFEISEVEIWSFVNMDYD